MPGKQLSEMIYKYDNIIDITNLVLDRVGVEQGWLKLPMPMTFLQGLYSGPLLHFQSQKVIVSIFHMGRPTPLCNHGLLFCLLSGRKGTRKISLSQCCCIDTEVISHAVFDLFRIVVVLAWNLYIMA